MLLRLLISLASTAFDNVLGYVKHDLGNNLFTNTILQYIQSTCATSGDGLYEGLEWLASALKKAGHS